MSKQSEKILILDGIGGVPLGREIGDALEALGSAVVHFDCLQQHRRPLYALRSAYAKAQNRRVERDGFYFFPKLVEKELQVLLTQERPSHILVIGFAYKFYDPLFLRRMADQFDAKLFLYDTDSCNLYPRRREFIFFVENELPIYDKIFSFSQVTTNFFRSTRRLNATHLPFGGTPIDTAVTPKTIQALFVGSCDLRRIFLLESICDHVKVFGSRWRRNFPLISESLRQQISDMPVWGQELHRLLSSAKIVLNITRSEFHGAETGINLRIFEALAAGCFLLTDRCEEVESLFLTGVEIETFGSSTELTQKLSHYLQDNEARERIANQGHQAFLQRHTWQIRASEMLLLMK